MGEDQIVSGTARNSHFSGEILLAGNNSHFFLGRGRGENYYYTIRAGGKTTI